MVMMVMMMIWMLPAAHLRLGITRVDILMEGRRRALRRALIAARRHHRASLDHIGHILPGHTSDCIRDMRCEGSAGLQFPTRLGENGPDSFGHGKN
jgi:hypothetical protein